MIHHLGGSRVERAAHVREALARVELTPAELFLDRYPHELSGGQRQRVAIAGGARARAAPARRRRAGVDARRLRPRGRPDSCSTACDESGLAILMITHDLSTAARFADRIAVMYLGRIVEEGPAAAVVQIAAAPVHEGAALGRPAPRSARAPPAGLILRGETPDAVRIPSGCRFHPRCPLAVPACRAEDPELAPTPAGHRAACLLV